MECIVLAGGLGTRLRSVIGGEIPKCMAPVAGKPFLDYLFQYLAGQQISHVVLSLGHAHEVVLDWLDQKQLPFPVSISIEKEPLGTGGGIQLAMEKCQTSEVFVVNGDTMLTIELPEMMNAHKMHQAETTIALKAMEHFERYGIVQTNEEMIITSFEEKAPRAAGNINGGIYLIEREALQRRALPEKFSFEKEYLEAFTNEHRFYAYMSEGYFMDIGVPEDYEQAQQDFPRLFHQ
jgi:D-glycero-alpha-D-manno-heptose 1-phosphate guanylyltransferase